MLSARSERRVRSGQPALDIDAEVARLLADEQGGTDFQSRDPGLVAEVRQLVVARNERRIRQGMEPLDVDSEVDTHARGARAVNTTVLRAGVYKRAMTNARRFQLDEITHPSRHLFQPPDGDHDRRRRLAGGRPRDLRGDEFDGEEWVLISEESPLDEDKRDDLVERFQLSHGAER